MDNSLNVPLHFWFNTNPGLAISLVALKYHEVKIELDEYKNWWEKREYMNFDIRHFKNKKIGKIRLWIY